VDLRRLACVSYRDLRGVKLGNGGLSLEILAAQHPRSSVIVGKTCGMGTHLHVGEFESNCLVSADGSAERSAGVRIFDRLVQASLCQTDGERRDGDAAFVEDTEKLRVAASLNAD